MYKGMLDLFDYTTELVKARPQRDSLVIVAYLSLGEVLKAAEYAMYKYFTLSLDERFLQNSHLGTPYQKWAYGTNNDFEQVTCHVTHLVSIIERLYGDYTINHINESNDGIKIGYLWFSTVRKDYKCCVINRNQPLLTLGELPLKKWLKPDSMQFLSLHVSISDLRNVPTTEYAIDDRSVLRDLQATGIDQTEKMRLRLENFSSWLVENITIQDVLRLSEPWRGFVWNTKNLGIKQYN